LQGGLSDVSGRELLEEKGMLTQDEVLEPVKRLRAQVRGAEKADMTPAKQTQR